MKLKERIFHRFFKEEIEHSLSLAVRAVDDIRDRQASTRWRAASWS